MNKITMIVSGGVIEDAIGKELLAEEINCIIGVDSGIEYLKAHDIKPDYIVGDFDSANQETVDFFKKEKVSVKEFSPEKDASDTEIAIRFALTLGAKQIKILGATGRRIDHLWANIQSLMIPLKKGVTAQIVDAHNCITLHEDNFTLARDAVYGPYFSVFSLSGTIYGLTIEGAKYPLTNHELTPFDSLSVSNEFVADEVRVSFNNGIIILMETKD